MMRKLSFVLTALLASSLAFGGMKQGTIMAPGTITAHSKPTVALANLGAGLVTSGTHTYKYTFLDSVGETLPSAASEVVTAATSTNGKVVVTVPTLGDGMTGANIYRTVAGNAGDYLLVNPSPVLAGDYTDNIADGSLGAAAPTSNTTVNSLDTEDFEAYADEADPTEWTMLDAAYVGAAKKVDLYLGAKALAVKCGDSGGTWRAFAEWTSGPSTADGTFMFDVYIRAGQMVQYDVYFRSKEYGEGTWDGVALRIEHATNNLRFLKMVNGSSSAVTNNTALNMNHDNWYRFKVELAGSSMKAKGWDTDDAEPGSWLIETTDTSVTTAGKMLIQMYDASNGEYWHFDNFSVTGPRTDPTTAPVVALANLGAGNCTSGDHTFKVAYVTADGVSALSAASDPLTCAEATNGKAVVTVAASAIASVESVNIYATKANESDYFLAYSGVANSNGNTTYNLADASLTAAAPTADTASRSVGISAATGKRFSYIYLRNNHATEKVFVSINAGDQADPVSSATAGLFIPPTTSTLSQPLVLGPLPFPKDGQPITMIRLRGETTAPTVTYVVVEE